MKLHVVLLMLIAVVCASSHSLGNRWSNRGRTSWRYRNNGQGDGTHDSREGGDDGRKGGDDDREGGDDSGHDGDNNRKERKKNDRRKHKDDDDDDDDGRSPSNDNNDDDDSGKKGRGNGHRRGGTNSSRGEKRKDNGRHGDGNTSSDEDEDSDSDSDSSEERCKCRTKKLRKERNGKWSCAQKRKVKCGTVCTLDCYDGFAAEHTTVECKEVDYTGYSSNNYKRGVFHPKPIPVCEPILTQPPTETPTEPPKPTTEEPTEPPPEPTTEEPTEPPPEPTTEEPTEPPPEPTTEEPTEPPPEPTTEEPATSIDCLEVGGICVNPLNPDTPCVNAAITVACVIEGEICCLQLGGCDRTTLSIDLDVTCPNNDNIQPGDECGVSCKQGTLVGPSTTSCQSTGEFDASPRCERTAAFAVGPV